MPNRNSNTTPMRWGIFCLNLLLVGILSFQCFIGFCIVVYGCIPLPTQAINEWFKKNPFMEHSIEGEAYEFSLSGNLKIVAPKLFKANDPNSILEASHLRIALQPKSNPISKIDIFGGTLFSNNPEADQANPILNEINLSLFLHRDSLLIDSFYAQYENLRLRTTAQVSLPALEKLLNLKDPETNQTDVTAPLDPLTLLENALQSQPLITQSKQPYLFLDLNIEDTTDPSLRIQFNCRALENTKFQAQGLNLETTAELRNEALHFTKPIHFEVEAFTTKDPHILFKQCRGRILATSLNEFSKNGWPPATFHSEVIRYEAYKLKQATLQTEPTSDASLKFFGYARGLDGIFALTGRLLQGELSGELEIEGLLDPSLLLTESLQASLPTISSSENSFCKFRSSWEAGFQNPTSDINIHFRKTNIEATHFDTLRLNASHSGNSLKVDSLYFSRGNQWLNLSFEKDDAQNQYRLETYGSVIPKEYNAIMPDWWKRIFNERFEFNPDSQVYGDCIIRGTNAPFSTDLYFGKFNVQAITYQNVPLTQGSLILRGRNLYTEIHKLDAYSDTDWLRGSIQFTGFPDGILNSASIRYDLESQLSLSKIEKLIPSNLSIALESFESAHAPLLTAQAAYFNQEDYPQYTGLSYLLLRAQSDASVIYKGVQFDSLNFDLKAHRDRVSIRDFDFSLAGGDGTGRIDQYKHDTNEELWTRLELNLHRANYESTRALVKQLAGNSEKESNKNANDPEAPGFLSANFVSEGPANDFFKHTGWGKFSLDSPELAKIQLLGPLSMILEITPLNFTSLKLNQMSGAFAIDTGFLKFSPLLILGPQTKMEANGTLQLEDQSLDMVLGIDLIGNVSEQLNPFKRITEVLNPLNYLMQFKVGGTLENQKIRSIYDPRNILSL